MLSEATDCATTLTLTLIITLTLLGKTLLAHTHADVDTSGASYFGATGLFVMSMDGSLAQQVTFIFTLP